MTSHVRLPAAFLFVVLLCTVFFPVSAHAAEEEVDALTIESALQPYFSKHLTLDLSSFYAARPRTATYEKCAASFAALSGLSDLIAEQMVSCVRGASDSIETLLDGRMGWTVRADIPYDWKMWACLYKQFRTDLGKTLTAHATLRAVENDTLDIIVSLPEPDSVFADLGASAVFQSWVDYSNLHTLYDEFAVLQPYQMPELTLPYLLSLVFPLDDVYAINLKDSWYQSRSRGTRRHMGTDIKANRKAQIYSCSDGEVVAVGYNKVGGYYVAVRDDFGYLYLYYHMFKHSQSVALHDRVAAGHPIGLVGNTGNSDINHLHLGIVAPDGTYVNAYTVMSHVLALAQPAPLDIVPPGGALRIGG